MTTSAPFGGVALGGKRSGLITGLGAGGAAETSGMSTPAFGGVASAPAFGKQSGLGVAIAGLGAGGAAAAGMSTPAFGKTSGIGVAGFGGTKAPEAPQTSSMGFDGKLRPFPATTAPGAPLSAAQPPGGTGAGMSSPVRGKNTEAAQLAIGTGAVNNAVSTSAAPSVAGAQADALKNTVNNVTDPKQSTTTTNEATPKHAASKPDEPNVLSDVLLRSQRACMKGGEAGALAHIQAFPHTSRAFSYLLPSNDAAQSSGNPKVLDEAARTHASTNALESSPRDRLPSSSAFSLNSLRHPTAANRTSTSLLATPDRATALSTSAGVVQALQLDEVISLLDKLLPGDKRSNDLGRSDSSALPSEASTPRSSVRMRTPRSSWDGTQFFDQAHAHHDALPEWKEDAAKASILRDKCFLTLLGLQEKRVRDTAFDAHLQTRLSTRITQTQDINAALEEGSSRLGQALNLLKQEVEAVDVRVRAGREDVGVVRDAVQTMGGKEREAQAVRPQLQRLQTLFQFRSVETVGRRQTGGGGGGLGGTCGDKVAALVDALADLLKVIAQKRAEYEAQAAELKRLRERRLVYDHGFVVRKATMLCTKYTEARRDAAAGLTARNPNTPSALKEALEASDPRLFKNTLPVKDLHDILVELLQAVEADFCALIRIKNSAADASCGAYLREFMAAQLLLRSASKKDAVDLCMKVAQSWDNLPATLTLVCIARCAALLPYYSQEGPKKPFKHDAPPAAAAAASEEAAAVTRYKCPLGLPTNASKDERRLPVPIDPIHCGRLAAQVTPDDTVFIFGKKKGVQSGVFCKVDSEWVRVYAEGKAEAGQGECVHVVRGVLGSEKVAHSEKALVVPHVLVPEGASGVTELYARLLVYFCTRGEEWGRFKPFHWMYDGKGTAAKVPEEEWRSPQEHLFAWFSSAARLCHVGGQEDRERAKYMLLHMHLLLQVAGSALLEAYPRQTSKIASALLACPLVSELVAKTKGVDPSLSQLLAVLASDKPRADKLCRLGELQAEADKAGASPAAVSEELPRVVVLLDEEVGRLQEQDQHDLDSVAKLKVGKSVLATYSSITEKAKMLHRTMRLEALPNEVDVDALRRLVSRCGEANAENLRRYLRAKMAECLVKDVVQTNAKMFTFAGGFQGYAWAAVLTTLAHKSAEGLDQLICVVDLAKWYMEHVAACSEPEQRIVTSQQAESKGVVNLFASLLQSEELPLEAARHIAETCIGAGKGAEVVQLCSIPVTRVTDAFGPTDAFAGGTAQPLCNTAVLIKLWVEAFCAKASLRDPPLRKDPKLLEPAELEAALERLDNSAEIVATILAVAGRVWDQRYYTRDDKYREYGWRLMDPNMAHRDAIHKLLWDTLLAPPLVGVCCQPQHPLYRRTASLRTLRKMLGLLYWQSQNGRLEPDWKEQIEGGKTRMQDAGFAEGDRTLREILKFKDD